MEQTCKRRNNIALFSAIGKSNSRLQFYMAANRNILKERKNMDRKKKKHYERPSSTVITIERQQEKTENAVTYSSAESSEDIFFNKWEEDCENG
jgi:hypothetical protein